MSSKKISPTLESLNTFFKTLGFVVFYASIVPFLVTLWFSKSLNQALFMGLAFGILAMILFLGTVKSQMLLSAVIPQMMPVSVNDYPRCDRIYLESYTQALEAMGFKHLGDSGLGGDQGKNNPTLGRIFWHSEHNCFAILGQNFSGTDPSKDVPMRCTFGSLLEKSWLLGTSDMVVGTNGFSHMMRRPKSLWQWFPDYGVEDVEKLLSNHLTLRQDICSTLNLEVQANLTLESYIQHEEDEGVQRHQALEKKPILIGLIEAYLFELDPKFEWLGDYAKFAKRNKKHHG